jgi:hypothetical protein
MAFDDFQTEGDLALRPALNPNNVVAVCPLQHRHLPSTPIGEAERERNPEGDDA